MRIMSSFICVLSSVETKITSDTLLMIMGINWIMRMIFEKKLKKILRKFWP